MDVVITEWALQTYLDLKHKRVFDDAYYTSDIRPNAEKLKLYPGDVFFQGQGWGPATDPNNGNNIQHGWKLKWKHVGSGRVQLRVCTVILNGKSYLCNGFVRNDKTNPIEMARLKIHISKISAGQYKSRGLL